MTTFEPPLSTSSGPSAASGNSVAFNGGNGVLVQGSPLSPTLGAPDSAEGNVINSNAIYGNAKLGIDLAAAGEGVTPNDLRDADAGPNRLQNHPVITEAVAVSTTGTGSATIRFTLHSEPSKSYRIEFFASVAPVALAMGVPLEALALLVAVETVPDLFRTVGNVTMDVAVTSIVARRTPD
jgi:hypothetical protein